MTSALGLHAMWNNKKYIRILHYIAISLVATVLFLGVAISAKEKDKTKGGVTGQDKAPVRKETKKKKVVKAPVIFVPTEKVSADQAVAFPIDI